MNLSEINTEGKLIGEVHLKNRVLETVFLTIGLSVIFLLPGMLGKLLGFLLAAVSLAVALFLKDRIVASVYDSFMLIYDATGREAVRIENVEIDEWKVDANDPNSVIIRLNDNEMFVISSLSTGKLCSLLTKAMPKKSTMEIVHEKLQGNNEFGLFRALRNLLKKR